MSTSGMRGSCPLTLPSQQPFAAHQTATRRTPGFAAQRMNVALGAATASSSRAHRVANYPVDVRVGAVHQLEVEARLSEEIVDHRRAL